MQQQFILSFNRVFLQAVVFFYHKLILLVKRLVILFNFFIKFIKTAYLTLVSNLNLRYLRRGVPLDGLVCVRNAGERGHRRDRERLLEVLLEFCVLSYSFLQNIKFKIKTHRSPGRTLFSSLWWRTRRMHRSQQSRLSPLFYL